jgi:nucleoside-diphosphate-sugar epimerase
MNTQLSIKDQNILVTGASGYIGPRLCRRLLHIGADVSAVSRTRPPIDDRRLRWSAVDLSDRIATEGLLKKRTPDIIFHLAGYAAGGREIGLVLPTFSSNLLTTVNVLAAASACGVRRIILPGSLEEPAGESSEFIPSSPYAASKWAASAYSRMFHKLYETPVVILRLFMTYGPGRQNPNKLIPYVIRSLLEKKPPELSSGHREIDWIFIDDAVEGMICSAQAPDISGETLDIGSGQSITIRALVEKLVGIIDPSVRPMFGALSERPMEQVRVADIDQTYQRTGWKSRVAIDDGLRKTVEWFQTHQ